MKNCYLFWGWPIQNSFVIVEMFVGNVISLALALQQTVIMKVRLQARPACYVFIHNLLVTCQVHICYIPRFSWEVYG